MNTDNNNTGLKPIGDLPSLKLINFPANVVNEKRAINMLGGLTKIRESFPPEPSEELNEVEEEEDDPPDLDLRLRPNDILSPPIKGITRATTKLLLRITSDPNQPNSSNVSIAGIIDEEVIFDDLCDFQRVETTKHNEKYPNSEKYNLPPLRFITKQHPTPLSLNTRKKLELENRGGFDRKKKPHRKSRSTIMIVDSDVKEIPKVPADKVERNAFQDKELYDFVQTLFEKRPIWLVKCIRVMCQHKFPKLKIGYNIRALLPQFSYRFKDGPYRRTNIKLGIDPRKDPKYACYQYIDFRPKLENYGTTESIFFDRLPNKQISYFQICDIRIRGVLEYIKNKVTLESVFSNTTGWYKKKDINEGIPDLMKEKLKEWVEEKGYHLKDPEIVPTEDKFYDILKSKKKKVQKDKSAENNNMDLSEE